MKSRIKQHTIGSLKGLALGALIGGVLVLVAGTAFGALLAHYQFNGNLNDETGNHNAQLRDTNLTATFQPGKSGDAVLINSVGNSLQVANPAGINLGTNFSVAAWINTDLAGTPCIFYKGDPANWVNGNKQFDINDGTAFGNNGVFFHENAGMIGAGFLDDFGISINDATWHHVAVTYDATVGTNGPRTTLWVDGIAKHTGDPGTYWGDPMVTPDLPNQIVLIGGRESASGSTYNWDGLIDEFQFYNRALTTNEVQFLFNNPGQAIAPPDIPEIYQQPQGQTITVGPAQPGTVTFSVKADGKAPMTYQWKFKGADLAGKTSDTLTLTDVTTASAGDYTMAVTTTFGTTTSDPATLTVILDNVLPTLISARTLGDANKVTVTFSEALAAPPAASAFAIDNGVTVTGVTPGDAANKLELTTSTLAGDQTYNVTVISGVKDLYGNEIAANSKKEVSLAVIVPSDFTQTVNGFQDDFTGATRDSNWVPVPAEQDAYVQTNGVLNVTTMGSNPCQLLYEAPGYNDTVQEVLARVRFKTLPDSGGQSIIGVSVGANPDSSPPGLGMDLVFNNTFAGVVGPHVQLLNDFTAWGPVIPDFAPRFNTWYWLRLRQTSLDYLSGYNVLGKAWLADGTQSEPPEWQARWMQNSRPGFAGIRGPYNNSPADADIDYILIKAEGLPSITVGSSSFNLIPAVNVTILQQPQDLSAPVNSWAVLAIVATSNSGLTYQWQKAAPNSTNFADVAGAISASYTATPLALADDGSKYRCVIGGPGGFSMTSEAMTLTVFDDTIPPALVSAKTMGNANQVVLVFTEPVQNFAATNFVVDNGITLTGVSRKDTNTIVLATSAFSADTKYTLTINGIKDRSGNVIASNSQSPVDMFMETPLEFGQTVNGFQDDFDGATRNPNWVPVPAGQDAYVQANGLLNITTMAENPNQLLYEAPGYSDSVQEVLARIRLNFLPESGAQSIVGVSVGVDPNQDPHPGSGIDLVFLNSFTAPVTTTGLHVQFLDDWLAWGPPVPDFSATTNTWYWLRLSQTGIDGSGEPNLFAKAWLADGTQPEPADWQLTWTRNARLGLAGIRAPYWSSPGDADVDYILIKAEGLPSIKVAAKAFALIGPRLEVPVRLALVREGNNVVLTWTGSGTLESAERITGPWTEVTGATTPHTVTISGTAQFYRVRR